MGALLGLIGMILLAKQRQVCAAFQTHPKIQADPFSLISIVELS